MKYYVQDSTRNNQVVHFNSLKEIISYLDGMVKRATGLSRAQYTQNLTDLGHGIDDPEGMTFVRSLNENFNIGVVRRDGALIKCDIHEATIFNKPEHGVVRNW